MQLLWMVFKFLARLAWTALVVWLIILGLRGSG